MIEDCESCSPDFVLSDFIVKSVLECLVNAVALVENRAARNVIVNTFWFGMLSKRLIGSDQAGKLIQLTIEKLDKKP